MQTDVLILGSGIAGLAFAIKLAERKPKTDIVLVTKADQFESNTKYAQGGIAAVMDNANSNYESHINDTLKAGKGFSNVQTVRMVVEKAPHRLKELIDWGTPFDTTSDSGWDYGLEGGHSVARILHHKDQTGLALEKALLRQLKRFPNIRLYTELFATDLLVQNRVCYGAAFLKKNEPVFHIHAKITYLATGGSGQVFSKTTNPLIATGDGVAMASRAGAVIENMGFYQYHPTALAASHSNPVFLISEALRGFGAHLINHQGERFVFRHHPDGELATRDVISAAIFKEMQHRGTDCVFLDCRHLDANALQKQFPNIIRQCKKHGVDLFKTPIPVAPAAHYQCGGIKVNQEGKTSLKGLYANGECSATGLHGANRLASNSLLEAVVFAHEAALAVSKEISPTATVQIIPTAYTTDRKSKADLVIVEQLKVSLQRMMYAFYLQGLVNENLQKPATTITVLCEKIASYTAKHQPNQAILELRNMALVAKHYVEDSLFA